MTAITLDLRPLIDQWWAVLPALPSESRYQVRTDRQGNWLLCRQQEATRGNGILVLSISLELGLKKPELVGLTLPQSLICPPVAIAPRCLGEDGTLAVSNRWGARCVPICPDFVVNYVPAQTRTARQDAGVPEERWAGWLIQRTNKLRFIVKGRLWKYFSHLLLCQEKT